jgi:ABC-2 type transport system permease protein
MTTTPADVPVASVGDDSSPPVAPAGPRRTLTDTIVLARRNMIKTLREPESLLDVTVIPIVFVLLFAYVIGPAVSLAGSGAGSGALHSFLIPGVLAFTMVTATRGTAVAVAADMHEGIIDRFRSLPMSRAGVLLGRGLADVSTTLLAIIVVSAAGLVIGWRPHHGAGPTIGALALVLLLGYALDWLFLFLGLLVRNVEGADQAGLMLMFVLGFISTALVPTNHETGWLRTVTYWNPVGVLATACRQLFGNPNPASGSPEWTMRHPVLASVIWAAAIIVVFAPAAVRLYQTRTSR